MYEHISQSNLDDQDLRVDSPSSYAICGSIHSQIHGQPDIPRLRTYNTRGTSCGVPSFLAPFVPYVEKVDDATLDNALAMELREMRIDTVQLWLQVCQETHGPRCFVERTPLSDRKSLVRPLYLIDVAKSCLVTDVQTARYVALSYCWGINDASFRLTKATVPGLLRPGSMNGRGILIPRTILDAMQLVTNLDERYLWVDRFCIVQDDSTTKSAQIAAMGDIYAGAFFTIIAAENDDPALGLYGNRKMMFEVATISDIEETEGEYLSCEQIMLDRSLKLMQSRWFSRGWTFQEYHLSRRKLVFHDDNVTWECMCAAWHDVPDMSMVYAASNSVYPGLTDGTLCDAATDFEDLRWPDVQRYARLLILYNERKLSFPEDIFDAFSGFLHLLSPVFPGGFISGLPTMCFDAALLWQPWTPMRPRIAEQTETKDAMLPSWSWAGWEGTIQTESWRSAAVYQLSNDNDDTTGQQCSWKTISTIQWYWSYRLESTRQPILVPAEHANPNLDMHVDEISPDWSCVSLSDQSPIKLYRHSSLPSQLFRYPIPLCYKRAQLQPVVNTRYLHCKTRRAFLKLDEATLSSCSECLSVELRTSSGAWAGVLRLPWSSSECENILRQQRREHNAMCELIEMSAGSVEDQRLEEKTFDEWGTPACPRHKGLYEFINVMWIRREGCMSYRRAVGRVEKAIWGFLHKETIEVTLA